MIITGQQRFIEAEFDNEQEIEDVVVANSEYFFGSSSIFIPKKLIKTKDGFGTIPDGFAIDLATRAWYVVEAELVHHSVWSHIAPQVAKQMIAVGTVESRQILEEIVVQMYSDDDELKESFKSEGIKEIDVRKVVGQILRSPPIVGMPIDKISQDLREWAATLKNDVRLWLVKKYVEFGFPENVAYEIPEEYKPVLDTTEGDKASKSGVTVYDVSLSDLLESGLLSLGEELIMTYKPRGGSQKRYRGKIGEDGSIVVLGKKFKSPSYAALLGLQDAGSNRKTVNGWTSWKNTKGKFLADLRKDYLAKKERIAESGSERD